MQTTNTFVAEVNVRRKSATDVKDDYQIYEQDQWSQSPSHSKTQENYVCSDSPPWGYSVDDN